VKPLLVALAVLASAAITPVEAADHARAAVACKPAGVWLAYDCTFKLTNAASGAPLQKAQLTVGADMPSKPLAYNIAPVAAKATATPGEYRAIVVLEVHGDWALHLKVGGPVKDQLVEMLNFSPREVGPAHDPNPAPPPPPAPNKTRRKH
jgi:hypothetical protein